MKLPENYFSRILTEKGVKNIFLLFVKYIVLYLIWIGYILVYKTVLEERVWGRVCGKPLCLERLYLLESEKMERFAFYYIFTLSTGLFNKTPYENNSKMMKDA